MSKISCRGTVPVDAAVVRQTREVAARHSISWWDAQIVAAAHATGAEILLTEDLQHGQDLDGLTVVNPFGLSPKEVLE